MDTKARSEWLDLGQATEEYPFSKRLLWLWISTGRLPAFKPCRRKTLVRRRDIERLILAQPFRQGVGQPNTHTSARDAELQR